jgi:hypothetical protein
VRDAGFPSVPIGPLVAPPPVRAGARGERAVRDRYHQRQHERCDDAEGEYVDVVAGADGNPLFIMQVPSGIVGPFGQDLCSAPASVVVPLVPAGGGFRGRKLALESVAALYDGRKDIDTLQLRCLPPVP